VLLDGAALGTAPGTFTIARGDTSRTLLVRHPDCEPQELLVVPNKDLAVAITLERKHRPRPAHRTHDKETIGVPDWSK
jgi:hypothetical protein